MISQSLLHYHYHTDSLSLPLSLFVGNYWFFNSLFPSGDQIVNNFLHLVQSDIEQGMTLSNSISIMLTPLPLYF
jgi:hypothetical protein